MAKKKGYPQRLKLLICCLGMSEDEARARLRSSRAPQSVCSQYEFYRQHPREQAKLLADWHTMQLRNYRQHDAADDHSQEELPDEACLIVAKQFLEAMLEAET